MRSYYDRHMKDGTFVSWIALLSRMFTAKEYRRMGIAKKLLSLVAEEAKKYGCGTIQITASDMGVLLYADFGFVKNGNFMQYKL